ncbi:HIRAN domain-containing protein [uncultured Methanobrevibacter sp.]|uniref:HIRAN domain-containing protein n=1 Tax=uncultured Methanobrevibacter sp. TaxID=253161 RepID=UPI0025F9B990|nr:HIRAN domain-containing protein [uncultured Methanobrevibacter sp.]
MTWEWKIGDPVDDATGGSMEAENWGHGDEDDENMDDEIGYKDPRPEQYGKKAWDLYMDFREEEALRYINMALDLDDSHAGNWNRKAIILEAMNNYRQSERCYNRSLELSPSNLVHDNKARMLYDWASQLLEESKKLPNGLDMLDEANNTLTRAIEALPGEGSEEDINKYLKLRDSINFYIDYERRYLNNLETLGKYKMNELFTITGRNHYRDVKITRGMPLRLVREPDNEFDPDAIAVYAGDSKAGYVANNDYTKHELTSLASQLKDEIPDIAQGEYLLYLERYAEVQFAIGRIIK